MKEARGAAAQMLHTSQQLRQIPEFLQQAFVAISTAGHSQASALQQLLCHDEVFKQLQEVS